MEPLKHPDLLHLRAAEGWLELGDPDEAKAELGQIKARWRVHPDVLEVKWHVYAKIKKWERCLDIANAIIRAVPERSSGWIHLSYSLHELKLTEDAYDNLVCMADHFEGEPVIAYNLACYSCRMGQRAESLNWLKQALQIGDARKIKSMALEDPDLEPLWNRIRDL